MMADDVTTSDNECHVMQQIDSQQQQQLSPRSSHVSHGGSGEAQMLVQEQETGERFADEEAGRFPGNQEESIHLHGLPSEFPSAFTAEQADPQAVYHEENGGEAREYIVLTAVPEQDLHTLRHLPADQQLQHHVHSDHHYEDHAALHEQPEQQQLHHDEQQAPMSFTILDQSVRELFNDDPHDDTDGRYLSLGTPGDGDETCDSLSTTYESSNNGYCGDTGVGGRSSEGGGGGAGAGAGGGYSQSGLGHSDSDNSSNTSSKISPFSKECLIPLPGEFGLDGVMGGFGRTFVRRRNERERARVRSVNDGFERLRAHLPLDHEPKDRRLSKVETLRFAIQYIEHLQSLLNE